MRRLCCTHSGSMDKFTNWICRRRKESVRVFLATANDHLSSAFGKAKACGAVYDGFSTQCIRFVLPWGACLLRRADLVLVGRRRVVPVRRGVIVAPGIGHTASGENSRVFPIDIFVKRVDYSFVSTYLLTRRSAMKEIFDSEEFTSAAYREFGDRAELDPAMLRLDDCLVDYLAEGGCSGASLIIEPSGLRKIVISIKRNGKPCLLEVWFSECEAELFRRTLAVVPLG
jgi:hypothetical protein